MARRDFGSLVAFQRFGLGVRMGGPSTGADRAASPDWRAAIAAEIDSGAALIRQDGLPDTARGIQIVSQIEERQREMREAKRQAEAQQVAQRQAPQGGDMTMGTAAMGTAATGAGMDAGASAPANAASKAPPAPDPDAVKMRDLVLGEARARIEHALAADIGFAERWALFWANHFCVALRRGRIMEGITGAYEREAIRPHVFGRFADMLTAAETHPAMLHYLDQRQSIGPGSPFGQRKAKGLNENLGREILELHTLGAGGGYTQADVTTFAKILTGWSITNNDENIDGFGGFLFAPNRHEPGPQVVLGKTYRDTGKEQGLGVLRDLAAHPATARFIAGKIARHFVADAPPPALVGRLEADFRTTGGDLAALARTLVASEEAWSAPLTKLRTPYEFVIAALRATGESAEKTPQLLHAINLMGQQLWNPPGPNGHADDVATMLSPKSVKTRLEFSLQFARQIGGRLDPRDMGEALYGEMLSPETRTAVARAETRPQGIAILLMAPEFQRR